MVHIPYYWASNRIWYLTPFLGSLGPAAFGAVLGAPTTRSIVTLGSILGLSDHGNHPSHGRLPVDLISRHGPAVFKVVPYLAQASLGSSGPKAATSKRVQASIDRPISYDMVTPWRSM